MNSGWKQSLLELFFRGCGNPELHILCVHDTDQNINSLSLPKLPIISKTTKTLPRNHPPPTTPMPIPLPPKNPPPPPPISLKNAKIVNLSPSPNKPKKKLPNMSNRLLSWRRLLVPPPLREVQRMPVSVPIHPRH